LQYIFYFLNKFTNQRIGIPTTITTIATIKKTKSAIVIATKPKNRLYSLTLITLSIVAFKSREFMSLFRFIFQHLIYFPTPLAPLRLPSVCLNKAEASYSGMESRFFRACISFKHCIFRHEPQEMHLLKTTKIKITQ